MFNKSGRQKAAIMAAITIMALAGPTISSAAATPDTAVYARVLEHFVTTGGGVRYSALKADPADLDAYLESLASIDAAELEAQPENERIAFWINAYNAITLRTIVDGYPIQGRGLSALRYPTSSIRQISGAWTDRRWVVAGSTISLDDIEHKNLRKLFQEPRVHMALVCAALGCPPLRAEPYAGARLDEQLDDQARRYLASPFGMTLEPERHRITVSAIFKWFAGDFNKEDGVRAFLTRYAPTGAARTALADPKTKIVFLDYDWTLNEAQGE